jgi:hypothetical protein
VPSSPSPAQQHQKGQIRETALNDRISVDVYVARSGSWWLDRKRDKAAVGTLRHANNRWRSPPPWPCTSKVKDGRRLWQMGRSGQCSTRCRRAEHHPETPATRRSPSPARAALCIPCTACRRALYTYCPFFVEDQIDPRVIRRVNKPAPSRLLAKDMAKKAVLSPHCSLLESRMFTHRWRSPSTPARDPVHQDDALQAAAAPQRQAR